METDGCPWVGYAIFHCFLLGLRWRSRLFLIRHRLRLVFALELGMLVLPFVYLAEHRPTLGLALRQKKSNILGHPVGLHEIEVVDLPNAAARVHEKHARWMIELAVRGGPGP